MNKELTTPIKVSSTMKEFIDFMESKKLNDGGVVVLDYVRSIVNPDTPTADNYPIPRLICSACSLNESTRMEVRALVMFGEDVDGRDKLIKFSQSVTSFNGTAFRNLPDVKGYIVDRYDTVNGNYLDLYVRNTNIERLAAVVTSNKGPVGYGMFKVSIPEWRTTKHDVL